MKNNIQIKNASMEDSECILQLLREVARWIKEKGINQWGYLLSGGEDEEILKDIVNKKTYIVFKDEQVIATFNVSAEQNEWDKEIWGEDYSTHSLYVHRLGVHPNYMKHGIGAYILNWIEEHFKNKYEYIKLDCVADNDKLNHFYQRHGYDLVETVDEYNKYQKKI